MEVLLIGFFAVLAGGTLVLNYCFSPGRLNALKGLVAGNDDPGSSLEAHQRLELDQSGRMLEKVKLLSKRGLFNRPKISPEDRFFQAGMFTETQKKSFYAATYLAPGVTTLAGFFGVIYYGAGPDIAILGGALGFLVGMQIPKSWMARRIAKRNEEIMYFLPLVIEQIVIGVSSSLDVGPCIQRVISMADERDTHNPVSELLRHAQNLARSGIPLDEALTEVGRLSGHTELKHAFMSLGQVSRHGGEITRQLQELASAVSGQRETKIEAKIRALELEATGPVGLVFIAFLSLLLIGIGTQVIKAV